MAENADALSGRDRWRGEFPVLELGRYQYTVTAWTDAFKSWHHDLSRWVEAEDIALALRIGADGDQGQSALPMKTRSG
ncbi:MAG: DUF3416 domain-containing protein [Candidatus Competibacteraceae bacterium]|nr:DUF3416 domain-containing protein [Candidatus Competibacteraceae bacterium]